MQVAVTLLQQALPCTVCLWCACICTVVMCAESGLLAVTVWCRQVHSGAGSTPYAGLTLGYDSLTLFTALALQLPAWKDTANSTLASHELGGRKATA